MSTGTVSDASRLLHVSVPAVSRVLSHAECQLGFLLFERIKGRLYPTAEARQLYAEVEHVYKGVKRIERLTHELAERRHGLLSVIASPSIGHSLVPRALSQFHKGHPEVRIHFDCTSSEFLKEKLLNRNFDLGVSTLPVDHPEIRTVPIASSRLIFICQQGHSLSSKSCIEHKDLVDMPLIAYPPYTPFGARIDKWFGQGGTTPHVVMQVGSPQNATSLVNAGGGVSIVDEFSLSDTCYSSLARIPLNDTVPIVAHLAYSRNTPLSPTSEAFIKCLADILSVCGLAVPVLDSK